MQNLITVKKLRSIVIPTGLKRGANKGAQLVATINAEMMRLGFIMSSDLSQALEGLTRSKLVEIYTDIIPGFRN